MNFKTIPPFLRLRFRNWGLNFHWVAPSWGWGCRHHYSPFPDGNHAGFVHVGPVLFVYIQA